MRGPAAECGVAQTLRPSCQCTDQFGDNASPTGGVSGVADALLGAVDHQRSGKVHLHGFVYLVNTFQHTALAELATRRLWHTCLRFPRSPGEGAYRCGGLRACARACARVSTPGHPLPLYGDICAVARGPWGPRGGLLGASRGLLERLGGLSEPLGGLLGSSWVGGFLGPAWEALGEFPRFIPTP